MTLRRATVLSAYAAFATSVLMAAPLCVGLVAERQTVLDAVSAGRSIDADHETRLRRIETDLTGIRVDVSWIRQDLERAHRSVAGQ